MTSPLRLSLRPWSIADATALREAIDEDVSHLRPWMNWSREEPVGLAATEARLARWVESFDRGESLRFAVEMENEGRILGGASLHRRIGPDGYDLGYWIRRSAAGSGVAKSATSRLIVFAFEEEHVGRLQIHCDVSNSRSAALASSLGFAFLRELDGTYRDGSPRALKVFEMAFAEYGPRRQELQRRAGSVRLRFSRHEDPAARWSGAG